MSDLPPESTEPTASIVPAVEKTETVPAVPVESVPVLSLVPAVPTSPKLPPLTPDAKLGFLFAVPNAPSTPAPFPGLSELPIIPPGQPQTTEQEIQAYLKIKTAVEGFLATLPKRILSMPSMAGTVGTFGQPDASLVVPPWATRIGEQLARMAFPTLAKGEFTNNDPNAEGRLAGHFLAMLHLHKAGKLFAPNDAMNPAIDQMLSILSAIVAPLMAEILDWPSGKTSAFLKGLSFAYDRSFDDNGMPKSFTDATLLYLIFGVFWQHIATLKSITELHEWLTGLAGPQLVGDQKRIEKICQRIGLRYRSKGRPRKSVQTV